MLNSRYVAENFDRGWDQFMESHSTPPLFSVSYQHLHHHNHHHPMDPGLRFRQPMQELPVPAMFRLDRGALDEEGPGDEQLGHHGLVKHMGLHPGVSHHQATVPFVNVNFELGLRESNARSPAPCYSISDEAQVLHLRQQDCYSTFKELPWRTLSIEDSNSNQRTSNEMENKRSVIFGELEAVCNLAKNREMNQTCSSSALNMPPIMALTAMKDPNVGPEGVNRGSSSSKSLSPRKVERRKKKRKLKEELRLTSTFLEALLKQVMDHQEFLQRKFLEVIERMERARREREEEWRRREARKHESEATARARERVLASSQEALIVTYIQKITGQSPKLQ